MLHESVGVRPERLHLGPSQIREVVHLLEQHPGGIRFDVDASKGALDRLRSLEHDLPHVKVATTVHDNRVSVELCLDPTVFATPVRFSHALLHYFRHRGTVAQILSHLTEEDWLVHRDVVSEALQKEQTRSKGHLTKEQGRMSFNGASGELVLQVLLRQMTSPFRRRTGNPAVELLSGHPGSRINLHEGYTLVHTSTYNCELHSGGKPLTEFDAILLVGDATYLFDASTSRDYVRKKLLREARLLPEIRRSLVVTSGKDSDDRSQPTESIVQKFHVLYTEDQSSVTTSHHSHIMCVPLLREIGLLSDATMRTHAHHGEYGEFLQRLSRCEREERSGGDLLLPCSPGHGV